MQNTYRNCLSVFSCTVKKRFLRRLFVRSCAAGPGWEGGENIFVSFFPRLFPTFFFLILRIRLRKHHYGRSNCNEKRPVVDILCFKCEKKNHKHSSNASRVDVRSKSKNSEQCMMFFFQEVESTLKYA